MDNASARAEEQGQAPETPEDVAILYSWANLPGAKYRDFSASRREFRAQQRARIAEAQRQAELKTARELEEAAEREVQTAQRQVDEAHSVDAQPAADAAQIAADAAAKREAEERLRRAEQRAEQERQEALRRQQAAEDLRLRAERAQEEMLEARKRAEEQAARYAEADAQKRTEVDPQTIGIPGETTDPYYYTGPVDPAYFAPTPGVRTAQATRMSTERRPYVRAAHTGSDAFDFGTAVPYRSSNPFAPSPAQQQPSERMSETKVPESSKPADVERPRAWLYEGPGPQYDFDESYYQKGRATRLFAPSPRDGAVATGEAAPADLHIRPASRGGVDSETVSRAVRPSPVPQAAVALRLDRVPAGANGTTRGAEEASQSGSQGHPMVPAYRSFTGDRQPTAPTRDSAQGSMLAGISDRNGLPPAPYEEADSLDDADRGSRMFLPGPRRRFSQTHARTPGDSLSEIASEWWREEPAAHEERPPAFARGRRRAEDRFVLREETGMREGTDMLPAEPVEARPSRDGVDLLAAETADQIPATSASSAAPSQAVESPQWRPVRRSDGEGGFRRRRQPAREPVARTARQPRSAHDFDVHEESQSAAEVSASPAWLSEERAARHGAGESQPDDASPENFPASPGDPDVPAPRQVLRRQSSSMRPRALTLPPLDALSNDSENRTAAPDLAHVSAEPSGMERAAPAADTLQQSRERVASRWFALSGLMGAEVRPGAEPREGVRIVPNPSPMLCVLSISGGVGKTSIVATLGRALSSMGEKVMLADTNVHGMLPYYFGARDHRPGAVRTFSPPPGSTDAPVVLLSYDADGRSSDEAGQKQLLEDLYRRADDVQRVLVDASVNSVWLARTLAAASPWVLVPVAPDMNSVLGTQAVERLFQDVAGADGRPIKPYYVLNQYDPTVPLHLDVREVLRQFLGDRLLPIMLHRTPAVSEALAEGMTVMDYAPRTPIANDYMNLAKWVRQLADPGVSSARPARWSER